MAKYLATESPDPDADDAGQDPTLVTKAHIESFRAWMIETRSASTALNKHKSLYQFFRYLLEDEEIDRSPMERVKHRRPRTSWRRSWATAARRSCSTASRARRSWRCGTRR
ncbi:phage integrase N-terminal SAM-like domain-containing protein [Actinoplanes auranticolor]|uniref:phage integrase N-terminal SAM-like domain-containing protein n=1 Tax=Actinoplanes auranticolor TaxID=47988 RepID=UPI001FE485D6|nr:phage integrase N-terminal SAM-like domain-containing protein [Actinoplanes auranticolor]